MLNNKKIYHSVRGFLFMVIAISLLVAVSGVAYAALYDILTNDGSVAEWESQSIAVFQTDSTGESGVNDSEDIVNTWIASGPSGGTATTIYFRLETVGDPALADNMGAVAAFDCSNDGNGNGSYTDPEDRALVHIPACCNPLQGCNPRTAMAWGDSSNFAPLGPDTGQRVDNYLEWSVAIADLPPDSEAGHLTDCQGAVQNVLFYTADVSSICGGGSGAPPIIDQSISGNPWTGWDSPSAIQMQQFEASSLTSSGMLSAVAFVVAIVAGAGLLLLARWNRKSRASHN